MKAARRAGGARQAVAFLTPLGGAAPPGPNTLAWFPVVGALMGLALGGVWWLANQAWSPVITAAVVVAADLALTGMLHFDGLVDSADGLLAHLTRARRLEVMAGPEVGAFGLAVAAIVLLSRWAGFASLRPAPLLVAGLWCASRTTMAVVATTQPYARPGGGLATAFLSGRRGRGGSGAIVVGGAVLSLVLAGLWKVPAGPVAVLAGVVAAASVVALARRKLGGFTGDVLGAAGMVGETVGLLVAAARW
jgi:adenosylcobinamide-GDP ribazoletransferase